MKSKTQLAFEWSMDELYKVSEQNGRRLYFWTFTFKECLDLEVATKLWSKLLSTLRMTGHRMFGVRRFELHPNGHGLHVHCLLDARLDVNKIRPIAQKIGFGRIHVVRLGLKAFEKTKEYLIKYLSKEDREPCMKGKRLWATCGKFKGVRVNRIEVISPFVSFFKKAQFLFKNYPYAFKEFIAQHCPHPVSFDDMRRSRQCFFYKILYIFNHSSKLDFDSTFEEGQFCLAF